MGSIRHDGRAGTGCSSSSNCRKSFDDQAARASYVDGAPNPVKAHLLAHSLRHLAQDRCPVRLGPGVRRNALFRGCPPLLELALIWTAAQMSAFRWRGGGPLDPAKRSACVTKAARVTSSFDDVRDAWR